MPTTLIVFAHPDPRSFNGDWARATDAASKASGQTVIWSVLSEGQFDPVEHADHYAPSSEDQAFDALKAQERAAKEDRLPVDVSAEIDKIRVADRVIFHFPMWWFAPPAVLKGWFDRVLAHGALHDVAHRFDSGLCRGKKALFCVTTGSSAEESAPDGREGDANLLLWPAAHTLRYLGFTVLQPQLVHGVHGYHAGERRDALHARLERVVAQHAGTIAGFDDLPEMAFNSDDDFDASGRLKADRPSHSPFIRKPSST